MEMCPTNSNDDNTNHVFKFPQMLPYHQQKLSRKSNSDSSVLKNCDKETNDFNRTFHPYSRDSTKSMDSCSDSLTSGWNQNPQLARRHTLKMRTAFRVRPSQIIRTEPELKPISYSIEIPTPGTSLGSSQPTFFESESDGEKGEKGSGGEERNPDLAPSNSESKTTQCNGDSPSLLNSGTSHQSDSHFEPSDGESELLKSIESRHTESDEEDAEPLLDIRICDKRLSRHRNTSGIVIGLQFKKSGRVRRKCRMFYVDTKTKEVRLAELRKGESKPKHSLCKLSMECEEFYRTSPFLRRELTWDISDQYFFCDKCRFYYDGLCALHPLLLVKDSKVNPSLPEKSRAEQTLPEFLTLGPSSLPGAGQGIFTQVQLFPGMAFGPYKGNMIFNSREADDSGYAFEVFHTNGTSHFVDARDKSCSNWLRYINCPPTEESGNLVSFQYEGHIFYRVKTVIPADSELLVWYGATYSQSIHGGFLLEQPEPIVSKRKSRIKRVD